MAEIAHLATDVSVERTAAHDVFTGPLRAILAAGVIESRHLEPQLGRRRGMTHFMPDGSPLAAGVPVPASLPGVVSVLVRPDGQAEVRRAVDAEERSRREEAASTVLHRGKHSVSYCGSRERLLRDGVAERWLDGVLAPGKKRGRRTLYEGEYKIVVSVSESKISVDVTHIDYYKSWGRVPYLRIRAEYGLPLIVRKHLTLVWSAP